MRRTKGRIFSEDIGGILPLPKIYSIFLSLACWCLSFEFLNFCAMQIGKQIVLKYRVLKSELSFSADAGTYMKQLSLIPINYLL